MALAWRMEIWVKKVWWVASELMQFVVPSEHRYRYHLGDEFGQLIPLDLFPTLLSCLLPSIACDFDLR
jgi:hypothetical protein